MPYIGTQQMLATLMQEVKDTLHTGDVQLRMTPLEEVFMAVARQAEIAHALRNQETTQLVLQDGVMLQVHSL